MARTVRNYAGEELTLTFGPPQWRRCEWPRAWDFFIPQCLPSGQHIGGIDPEIRVYESGRISWPGQEAMKFDTPEEAKAFVEATYALEGGVDG